MNIYIHTEIFVREFDSKLLLAVIAASRGHNVIIADKNSLLFGIKNKYLHPGIFHTKSITPSLGKIERHNFLNENGFKITSIDEEAGVLDYDYEQFAVRRFASDTVNSASLIFSWGQDDFCYLRNKYSQHQEKFILSGSPRVDMWSARLSGYWDNPFPTNRPYLLVASNMGLHQRPIYETIKLARSNGYIDRDPQYFKERLLRYSENICLIYEFVLAINKISDSFPDIDIVFRPHPNENIEAWEVFLKDIPRVSIIREGSISAWVNHSFAVLHNSCTTALEAVVAKKPVVAYLPITQNFARDLPNDISLCAHDLDGLIGAISSILKTIPNNSLDLKTSENETLNNKIFIDDYELAAMKIVKYWETLDDGSLSRSGNYLQMKIKIQYLRIKNRVKGILRSYLGANYPEASFNHKFPPMDEQDICRRVERLQKVLGITEPLECKLLAERVVRITKKTNLHG